MPSKPSKYGSSSGGSDPFKNATSSSMSKKLKEPRKKKGDSKKEDEHSVKRRTQNRNSQRAYRERREQRLSELESQVQQAEALNETLTSAYQELRSELDRLEAEKAQEQYYDQSSAQPSFTSDTAYVPSGSVMTAYGQGDSDWGNSSWEPQEWQGGDDYNYQG
ncbi:unnamed protein product [Discula destructiva]